MIVNDELKIAWKEAVVIYLKRYLRICLEVIPLTTLLTMVT
jgi:hypothetical protein